MPEIEPVHKQGKPWNVIAKFSSYEEAKARAGIIEESWLSSKEEGMEVKIKRMADGIFFVKTRLHPDFDKKKTNKKKKRKKTNG